MRGLQRLQRELERHLLPGPRDHELAEEHWRLCCTDAGVDLERVLRVRADTRGVFLVRHPEWGRCVLKTVQDAVYPDRGYAQLAVATSLSSRVPVFPEVLRTTTAYTLERYVEGRPFLDWWSDGFQADAVSRYFAGLRALQGPGPVCAWGQPITPEELRLTVAAHLRKCLRHVRFLPPRGQAAASARLVRRRPELQDRIDHLWSVCDRADVPRVLMCGDMGHHNILVRPDPVQLVNIDYETLGPGHWGFDACLLVYSLTGLGAPASQLQKLRDVALDPAHLSDSAHELFTGLTDLLLLLNRTMFGDSGVPDADAHGPAPVPTPRAAARPV